VKGQRTRTVFCGSLTPEGVTKTEDSKCEADKKYSTEEDCDLPPEFIEAECFTKAAWFVGPWGACSKGACTGQRSRTVLCIVGNSTTTDVSKCGEDSVVFATEECQCDGTSTTSSPGNYTKRSYSVGEVLKMS